MVTYEELLIEADNENLNVYDDYELTGNLKGLYYNGSIAIRKDLTVREKKCVLAEEIGHYKTTYGDILDQRNVHNRKRERKGKIYAYDRLIGMGGLIECYHECVSSTYEMTEVLDVTEEFLNEALAYYTGKYGTGVDHKEYYIQFIPYITVIRRIDE